MYREPSVRRYPAIEVAGLGDQADLGGVKKPVPISARSVEPRRAAVALVLRPGGPECLAVVPLNTGLQKA